MPVEDTSTRDNVLAQVYAKHGNPVGNPVIDEALSKTVDKYGNPVTVDDPYYTYSWPDGSSVTINGAGTVAKYDEKPNKSQAGFSNIRNVGNEVWGTDPTDGQFKPIPGVPQDAATKGFTNLAQVPQADGSKVYYGTDPADGNFKRVPGAPVVPVDTSATHPNVVDQNTGTTYIWDPKADNGKGGLGVYTAAPGLPQGQAKPQEGDTRPNVQNGLQVQEVYRGGSWVTDPSVPSKPYSPATQNQPKEGDTRPNVQNGYAVREIYKGGQWVVDPSQAPTPYTPATQNQPKEGDTRQNVQSGYGVQEVYKGGQWVVDPSVAPTPYTPTTMNQPKEGDTRPNVQSGYQVQEVYKGGSWVVDPSVAPTRFTPQAPTQVSADTTALYKQYQDPATGAITNQINPNFQPKTQADVAARVGQLQQAAQAKRDELSQKMQAGLSAGDAATQFDSWWAQNVEPQKAQLAVAQQQAAQDQQRLQEEQTRANYATAQAAGTQAINAFQTAAPFMVGPGFGAALNSIAAGYASGKAPQNLDIGSAVTFKGPDLGQLAQTATSQALAHISPTAAAIATGSPTPGLAQAAPNLDVNQQLNQTSYVPGTASQPAAPPPVPFASQPYETAAQSMARNAMPLAPATGAPVNAMPFQPYQFQPASF